ncbi:MAG: lipid-A-disaccharide synthase [Gammaproteobacteria bacterium]|nr:MAG: lipid-A-disaccharide synthase [Gammaproteobacteria bacterium]
MVVAGEASGDLHAAHFVEALRQLRPQAHFSGMGSRHMREAGVELLVDADEVSVMGVWEVLVKYPHLRERLGFLRRQMLARRPDLLVLVDFVEFNLKLAEAAKAAGIPVLFYVSPQIWAWRPGRVKKIGERIDMMATIFPFEVPYYREAGIPVRYVGHPLVDEVRIEETKEEARSALGLEDGGPLIGLLPGSRQSEVARILPILLDSAELIRAQHPDARFVIPVAHTIRREMIEERIAESGLPVQVVDGQSHRVMRASDVVVTASGTATLEVALVGTPMVIVYRLAALSHLILSRLVTINHVGLPNIVAGREIVREFIQGDARPEAIAEEALRILDDPAYRHRLLEGLAEVRTLLGEGRGPERIAQVADEMLEGRILSE